MSRLLRKTGLVVILIASMLMIPAAKAEASSESTVVLGNVIGSGVTSLARGWIQGNVHSFKDAVKCLGYGLAAGYGFYQSKKLVASGNTFAAVMLANLSASVVDNVTAGEGPLSYLGFTLPLLRVEFATPLAKKPKAYVSVSVSPRDAISLVMAISKSDRVFVRGGMLAFEADAPLAERVVGWAYGICPTVLAGQPDWVFNHEMVHVMQSLQLMAGSPEPFLKDHRREEGKAKFLAFQGFRVQALGLVNDFTLAKLQSYDSYWKEAEAYSLVSSK